VHQSPWITNSMIVFSIHYEPKRNVLLVVLHGGLNQYLQEFDPITLKPGRFLGQWHLNAPQRGNAFYNTKTQLLTQIVEHDFYDNYWMVTDCSSATNNATVRTLAPFKSNTQTYSLTYDQGTSKVLATYSPPNKGQPNLPVQAFYVDPITGAWPVDGGVVELSPSKEMVGNLLAPLNKKTGLVLVILTSSRFSLEAAEESEESIHNLAGQCPVLLLNFAKLSIAKRTTIPCERAKYSAWFSLS